jgi:hypothetical protein
MKRKSLWKITVSVLLVAIIIINVSQKRSFFKGQKDHINFNYYFIINKYPSILYPFSNKFKYETNIYGSANSGFITEEDSVIYYLEGSEKYLFVDLRKDKDKFMAPKKMIPELNLTNNDYWYEFDFMTPPHSFDTLKGLRLRITYEAGIDSIVPLFLKRSSFEQR